jgi:Cytochrome P460
MATKLCTRQRIASTAMFGATGLFLIAVWSGVVPRAASAFRTQEPSRATFAEGGSIRLPTDYRQWTHIGTRIKVGGLDILDGTKLTTPQVLNAYVEPSAFAAYMKTGKWADGTQIVKEISAIKVGQDCDSTTYLCKTPLGSGIFEEKYTGIGMMVKDSKRFPSNPGNWGYFAFFRTGSTYESTAKLRPQDQCAFCHVNLASDTDYVISKAHLALQENRMQ